MKFVNENDRLHFTYTIKVIIDEDAVCGDVYNMKENVQQLPMKFISNLKYFLLGYWNRHVKGLFMEHVFLKINHPIEHDNMF